MTTIVQTQDRIRSQYLQYCTIESDYCTLTSVIAVLSYYITQSYTDLIFFSTTFPSVLHFLQYYPSMITRSYRIHGHMRISHATFPGTYASLIHSLGSYPTTYLRTVLPLTLPGYLDNIIRI